MPVRLARVCQFGLASANHVPPKAFREVWVLTRYRCSLMGRRGRVDEPEARFEAGLGIAPDVVIYTDETSAYEGLPNHEAVTHSTGDTSGAWRTRTRWNRCGAC